MLTVLLGKVLTLTILSEIRDISRFDRVQAFASYARLVKCAHPSAGKTVGTWGAKMGTVHLKGAFSETAVLFLRHALHSSHGAANQAPRRARVPSGTAPPPGYVVSTVKRSLHFGHAIIRRFRDARGTRNL